MKIPSKLTRFIYRLHVSVLWNMASVFVAGVLLGLILAEWHYYRTFSWMTIICFIFNCMSVFFNYPRKKKT